MTLLQFAGSLDLLCATRSGHIEPSSLQGQHDKPRKLGKVTLSLYIFRHACLTSWAAFMEPWTLAEKA